MNETGHMSDINYFLNFQSIANEPVKLATHQTKLHANWKYVQIIGEYDSGEFIATSHKARIWLGTSFSYIQLSYNNWLYTYWCSRKLLCFFKSIYNYLCIPKATHKLNQMEVMKIMSVESPSISTSTHATTYSLPDSIDGGEINSGYSLFHYSLFLWLQICDWVLRGLVKWLIPNDKVFQIIQTRLPVWILNFVQFLFM